MDSNNHNQLLASSGDYRQLICYQKSVVVYDLTYWFCEQYMNRSKDRTVDQMVQAARSGKTEHSGRGDRRSRQQRVGTEAAEGRRRKPARTTRGLRGLAPHTPACHLGEFVPACRDAACCVSQDSVETKTRKTSANIAREMTEQALYFLDRLIQSKAKQFVENGDLKEQMYRARQEYRQRNGWARGKEWK